jgi:hypothetical protein
MPRSGSSAISTARRSERAERPASALCICEPSPGIAPKRLAGSRIPGFSSALLTCGGDGSHAYYSVYLDAEGRFVAVGMPES